MTSAGAGTRSSSAARLRFTNLGHSCPGDRRKGLDLAAGVALAAADLEAAARALPGLVAPFHRGAAAETALGHAEQSGLRPGRLRNFLEGGRLRLFEEIQDGLLHRPLRGRLPQVDVAQALEGAADRDPVAEAVEGARVDV